LVPRQASASRGAGFVATVRAASIRLVRAPPREHLVQDHAEGEDVAAHVDRRHVAARLLRAHVRDGAADHALMGERAVLGVLGGQPREAEVEDLHHRRRGFGVALLGRRHDDVQGLQVAVDHAALVRVVHSVGDRAEHLEPLRDLLRRQRASAGGEPLVERLSAHQLHREVVVPVGRVPRLVDRGDVGVPESAERLGLAAEHAGVDVVDVVPLSHDLDGDAPARAGLLGLPHHAHAALAEEADDAVVADRLGRSAPLGEGRRQVGLRERRVGFRTALRRWRPVFEVRHWGPSSSAAGRWARPLVWLLSCSAQLAAAVPLFPRVAPAFPATPAGRRGAPSRRGWPAPLRR
jgi:hypothetical protein